MTRTLATLLLLTILTGGCGREPAAPVDAPPASTATTPAPTAPAAPSPKDAEALVARLYRDHDGDRNPFFQNKDRALVDSYFERSLADLIWKDVVDADGVGALDFDPLYDAQDYEAKQLVIHPAQVEGDKARVLVSFESFGAKRQLTWVLVPVDGAWRISDVEFGEGRTLRGVYTPRPA